VIFWLKPIRWIVFGIVLHCLVHEARGLDPNRLPSQYVREEWITASRFPGGAVNTIGQGADGYLWIGTDKGLIRFDGFDFKSVSFTSDTITAKDPILQLLADAAGRLWLRPQGTDVLRQLDGKFESVTYGQAALSSQITAVSKDSNGGVLLSDIAHGTFRFKGDEVQKLAAPAALPGSSPVISMAETAEGKIWMGTLGDGLFLFADGRAGKIDAGLPDRKINCLLPIGNEELWVGTDFGLYHGNDKGFRRVELPSSLGSVQVLSMLRDRDSNIWVGTARGLLRINAKGTSFSEERELRGDGGINALFEDREGNLWIGGAQGLGRIRDSAFLTYSTATGLPFERNGPIYVDADNRTWFAPAQGGLYVLQNGRVQPVLSAVPANDVVYSISGSGDEVWLGRQRGGLTRLQFRNGAISSQTYTEANGLAQNSVYAVYESRDGSVWAGTLSGGVSKFKDGRFTTYTTSNGLASNTISSVLETRNGGMWFATFNGLSSFANGKWRTYTTRDGLLSPGVNCLFEDSSGTLWVGTPGGLAFFASDHFQVPTQLPEVLREQILGIAEDKNGRLWIAVSNDVLRVSRDQLIRGNLQAADVHEFGPADGLLSNEGVKRSRSVITDPEGKIWFSLNRGLSVVDPAQLVASSAPAIAHIETVSADGAPINSTNLTSLALPQRTTNLQIGYTALSLAVPERIRFRYRLEEVDRDWQDAGTRREAFYTRLGPGKYHFRVIACNSDGVWNEAGAELDFNIAPAYYQTTWFRALCVLAFFTLLWTGYLMRVHQLREQEKKFRDAVETMPALAFVADRNGDRTFLNRGWLEYTGLSSEQASGSGWEKAVHPDDLKRVTERWRESQTTGESLDYELRLRRGSDGAYRWFQTRARPLRDDRGKIVKWCAVANDIEDRKDAEQLRADLTHASRVSTMGELVASISHELAQPITATTNNARASLRWLQRDPPDLTQVRKGTESIIEAGTLASEIIDRLRSLYKKSSPKRELVAINEVIGEMAGMLRSEARRHGVSIRTNLKGDLPMTVADRVQLQQVLMNLILNGIEAIQDTGGVVTVKSQLGEDGQIEISVNDTGPGLPLGKADQIFDAFFTTKPQGSGMGLAISKSIVESHGGRIWASGDGGRGATFHFTLPAAPAETNPPVEAA
jgi:PAS domain S-box-containing protein